MTEIKLMSIDDAIYVQLWTNGAWRHKICGQVIGSYEGMVGLLLDNGEYVDVTQECLRTLETK
ncbi:hypothetical protein [Enterocloster citroniae]|uniref:hypothetical protein n=1 Tax=Enterocloster citroniae TaxID=358743 RepID=UPI0022E8FC59|nr:hypothetical protein [Enterocloster citroniae]